MIDLQRIQSHQIDDNEMNRQLADLYSTIPSLVGSSIDDFNANSSDREITNPYLLAVSRHYYEATKRVMVIGQETLTWLGEVEYGVYMAENIPKLLPALYDVLVNEDYGFANRPWWNLYQWLIGISTNVGFIANDVAKFGYVEEKGFHREINKLVLSLLREEIRICKPDLLLFLSGPNYDQHINDRLPIKCKIPCLDGISERQFCKIEFEDPTLPVAFRTYHPGYLYRKESQDWPHRIYSFLSQTFQQL